MTDVPTEIVLSREAAEAGLVVTCLLPITCAHTGNQEYNIQIWQPDGGMWAEGTHETAEEIRGHIASWRDLTGSPPPADHEIIFRGRGAP